MSRENIIQHFPTAIDFIDDALKDKNGTNAVLVHCFYGVSRSSTLVIAYLMKKYSLTYQKAFERAKSKRSLVHPNHGFAVQCKLFYKMNYTIDPQNKYYKVFRLKLAAEKIKSAKILPSNFMDLIRPDPGEKLQEYPEPYVYRCKKCRRVVASKSNLILHKVPKEDLSSYDSPSSKRKAKAESTQKYLNNLANESGADDQDAIIDITDKVLTTSLSDRSLSDIDKHDASTAQEYCSKIYFIEPIAWMKEVINNVEGKLHCPSCRTKIGSFNWIMASKCPCGAQVAPSFYLVPSKIDFSNIVQNIVQVTI